MFIDGTAIEVDGKLFEEARRGYDGTRQYWLHGVFIGSLWASGRLPPGGGDVAGGWREQLDSDVAPCVPEGTPVWLRADNAYYRGELIACCRVRGWDYSISLTHAPKRAPALDVIEGLPEEEWTDIGLGEDATLVRYRPASRPAAPDPLPGSGRRQTGAQRPTLAAGLRAHQLPARLALQRRGPARIEAPGAERSVPGRNRQARCRPLVRRTAKRTDRPTNPSHPTSRRTRPHRVRHRCTRKPASRASIPPVLNAYQGIEVPQAIAMNRGHSIQATIEC